MAIIEAFQGAEGPDAEPESRRACQTKSYKYPTKPGVRFRPIADVAFPVIFNRTHTLVRESDAHFHRSLTEQRSKNRLREARCEISRRSRHSVLPEA